MNSRKPNPRPLVLLLALFVLPVVLAKLVLTQHWYTEGATNQGQLFADAISYQSLGATNPQPERWQILYQLPKHCDERCQDRLFILRQSHTALGAEQKRVIPLVLTTADSDARALKESALDSSTVQPALTPLLADGSFILVDPMGTLVMQYPSVEGRDANISQGKAMLADLRKLLKLSRIG